MKAKSTKCMRNKTDRDINSTPGFVWNSVELTLNQDRGAKSVLVKRPFSIYYY